MTEYVTTITAPEHGGPEVYTQESAPKPTPGDGQLLVRVTVSGVNYLDVSQRTGTTPLQAPFAAGVEGVGVVESTGDGVSRFAVGQRVGWMAGGQGSFSDYALVDQTKAVGLPDSIDDEVAAASLMQGITAHYLTTDTHAVSEGDVVVVHAAAGGLGQLLTQIAKLKGATVIGTTSSEEKAEIARANGADYVVDYGDLVERVQEVTGGDGATVVYDGVGKTTFDNSMDALGVRGTLALIGNASGPVEPVDVNRLNAGGSLFLTRPTVMHHIRTPEELDDRIADVFRWIRDGSINITIGQRFTRDQVTEAFEALESRGTTGKTLILH